ncbi:MAG: zinc ABC transporter substrate-binding protein [Pseudomonadales bacterium]|nr:zinc ABC transporter substrate-binding protein [Pseudomonadales bacterium]
MPTSPLISFVLVLLVSLLPRHSLAQTQVVASIKPLQMIAAAITDGVSEPGVIIPPNQSPHNFNLRPSDVARLADADFVLWVGPGLETYLAGVLQQRGLAEKALAAASLPGIFLMAMNEDGHLHEGETYDPHLWLSTRNAVIVAKALGNRLTEADPQNAERYKANMADFEAAMTVLESRLQARFDELQDVPFAVYHNGTHYLESQVGIEHIFVLVPDHEIQPGIRHLLGLREQIESLQPVCLLEDINANAATVDTVFRDYPVRRVILDTLGQDVTLGRSAYENLIAGIASAIAQCLSP